MTQKNWAKYVSYIAVVTLILLVVQYLLGLWTNVYAPTQFSAFDATTKNYPPSLNAHIEGGDVLFFLAVIALVFSALAKQIRLILPALILLVSVFAAGEFGMAFVNSSPNNPADSFGMGAMFLLALFSALALVMSSVLASRKKSSTPGSSTGKATPA